MALTGVSAKQSYAADGVDVNRKDCTITVSVDILVTNGSNNDQNEKYVEDFRKMKIPVDIYRVAEVDVTGQKYTNLEPFESVDLSDISSTMTAENWKTKAADAVKDIEKAEPAARMETSEGVAKFEGLSTGMYLVVPAESYNADYTTKYKFTPYLTALPGSEYTLTGQGSDEWDYDTEIGLKPEAEPQFGELIIHKTLENYNETLGQATFVFMVEGIDEDGNLLYDAEGKPVYSEVVSTTHKGLATEEVRLEKIPAGITVRVTEIYSGASYEVSGDDTKNVLIWSDALVGETVDGAVVETAEVSFQNRYNGGNRGGYGVTNEFTSGDAGWEWTKGPAEEE